MFALRYDLWAMCCDFGELKHWVRGDCPKHPAPALNPYPHKKQPSLHSDGHHVNPFSSSIHKIFHREFIFFTISIHFRSFIAADRGCAVADPRTNLLGIMADSQSFQTTASMEHPFAELADAGGKFHMEQTGTFEKCTVSKLFQRLGKNKRLYATEIKCVFTDARQSLWKANQLYRSFSA